MAKTIGLGAPKQKAKDEVKALKEEIKVLKAENKALKAEIAGKAAEDKEDKEKK